MGGEVNFYSGADGVLYVDVSTAGQDCVRGKFEELAANGMQRQHDGKTSKTKKRKATPADEEHGSLKRLTASCVKLLGRDLVKGDISWIMDLDNEKHRATL